MLPELHAEQQLAAIEAASVPHMTAEGQRATTAKYRRLAGRQTAPQTLGQALAAIPMRRETVPKET